MQEQQPLKTEYQYFLAIKPQLLKEQRGKFALIKGRELIGTFDTDQDAYKAGLGRFGNVPFLIARIQDEEERAWIPALSLGLNTSI